MKYSTFLRDDFAGTPDGYKLLTGLIVPRPIGWIGSTSAAGVHNLAPYSFFNAVSGDPPTVVFSPGAAGRKDTRDNVLASGEFTVNIVTMEVVDAMNATAATQPAEGSEFELAGLTAVPSRLIDAPRVAQCRATLECQMTHHLDIGNGDDKNRGGNVLIVGEVVAFHIDDDLLDGTRIKQAELRAVGRHAGNWYSEATKLFERARPD